MNIENLRSWCTQNFLLAEVGGILSLNCEEAPCGGSIDVPRVTSRRHFIYYQSIFLAFLQSQASLVLHLSSYPLVSEVCDELSFLILIQGEVMVRYSVIRLLFILSKVLYALMPMHMLFVFVMFSHD